MPVTNKNEREAHKDLNVSHLTDSNEDIVTLPPPGQYFKENKPKISEVVGELESKMNKKLLDIGVEEQDYQRSKQKELTDMQQKEAKMKERNEKPSYDQ